MGPSGTPSARFWSGPGALLAGLVHGLFVVLMFPPVGLWPLALVAILPLAFAAVLGCGEGGRPWRAGLLAAAGVLPAWLYEQRWIIDVAAVGYPLLALSQAVMTGAFVTIVGLACSRLRRWAPPAVVVPVAWVGVECFRAKLFFTGYPWYGAGHPLIEWPVLALPAAWVGALGVSLLVAALAGGIVALAHPTAPSRRLGLGMIAVAAAVWGAAAAARGGREEPGGGPVARIAVVQTSVPQNNKIGWSVAQRLADWDRFADLTRRAAAMTPRPDMVVWPETMFPGDALNTEAVETIRRAGLVWAPPAPGERQVPATIFADRILDLQREVGVPLLVGAIAMDGLEVRSGEGGGVSLDSRDRYNSAMIVRDGAVQGGEAGRYDKMHLTPFGEAIPYVWRWPAVQNAVLSLGARGMRFDLSHGAAPRILEVPLDGERRPLRLVTPISFEATIPAVCRVLAYREGLPAVDALVNLSNDGWFGRVDGGREQHLQLSRWRCVELGVPMVRAVNTGVSASVDRRGRLVAAGPQGMAERTEVEGVLVAEVRLGPLPRGTLYGRTGDVVGWTALAATALLLAGCAVSRRAADGSSGKGGVGRGARGETGAGARPTGGSDAQ